jgi:exodeoxyribonuclease-3
VRQPDLIALQETRCAQENVPPLEGYSVTAGMHVPASGAYCGVAIYAKKKLGAHHLSGDFCEKHDDCRGRYVEVELADGTRIASVYVPSGLSGNAGAERFDVFWGCLFERMCRMAGDRVILVGDLNTTLYPPLDRHGDVSLKRGDGPREVEFAKRLREDFGWTDSFRALYPAGKTYSFWPSIKKGESFPDRGTRIDYQLVTRALSDRIVSAAIRVPDSRSC